MASINATTIGSSGTLTKTIVPKTAPMTPLTASAPRLRVSRKWLRSLRASSPLASRFGSAMITTASSMSTNNAATGMTMTGRPMPVTAFETEPITTATSTIVSS